ncbi:MAG: thiamine-phosphate synthase family protein [Candidatus Thorarchaeota archaeon]
MRPPCEVAQREFLPLVRVKLAKALKEQGFSQVAIAEQLDVTQAAVSKYLNQHISRSALIPEIDELVERLLVIIRSPSHGADHLVKEVCSACMYSRVGYTLCFIHQDRVPSLMQTNCHICSDLLGGQEEEVSQRARTLSDMRDALRTIETTTSFREIVPQVRANLVACGESASTVDDVAGVPGRITVVGNQARALIPPQFGASRHTAELLLRTRRIWRGVRACLCISGHERVVKVASDVGFKIVTIRTPETQASEIIGALSRYMRRKGASSQYPALRVPGGLGVEPILYLFGPNATDLSLKCSEIANRLARSPPLIEM